MNRIAQNLLKWYAKNGRTLPWRGSSDSYAIWISEIMLQQTRVEVVIPYYSRWMERFPTVKVLAKASEQDVLKSWEGLGYYSRARNLHKSAKIVIREFAGELPRSISALRKLPGIGRYTAGAIASIAFGMDEPTLDGNLRRVYARLTNLEIPADSTDGEKKLWSIAAENLPVGRAGDFNQALMDLGATICLPKKPNCTLCPLKNACQALKNGAQEKRPILKPKDVLPTVLQGSVVIVRHGRVLLARRPLKGLLGGLWEFPNGRIKDFSARELPKAIRSEYGLSVSKEMKLGTVRHAYSHFRVDVQVYSGSMSGSLNVSTDKEGRTKIIKWVKLSELEDLPMGKIDRQIARKFTSRQT